MTFSMYNTALLLLSNRGFHDQAFPTQILSFKWGFKLTGSALIPRCNIARRVLLRQDLFWQPRTTDLPRKGIQAPRGILTK